MSVDISVKLSGSLNSAHLDVDPLLLRQGLILIHEDTFGHDAGLMGDCKMSVNSLGTAVGMRESV